MHSKLALNFRAIMIAITDFRSLKVFNLYLNLAFKFVLLVLDLNFVNKIEAVALELSTKLKAKP